MQRTDKANNSLTQNPIFIFATSLIFPLAGTFLIGLLMLNISNDEIQQLITFMTGTGILTTLLSYSFYRLGILQWLSSLRWSVLVVITITVAMVFLNVWVIARFTFVDFHYFTLTTALLVFAGLSAVTIGFFASKTMTERLDQLNQATHQLAGGDLSTRLNVEGNDEIAQLADTFNHMAKSLQEVDEQKRQLEQSRRDLIAWVSHDLRTPLASMRVMIEAMSDGVVTDEETVSRYLSNSSNEIQHLSHLIDDLFELAQLDVGHLPMDYQPSSIRDLISDTLGSLSAKAKPHDIQLKGEVAPDVDLVEMAPDKIQRVLSNLIDNAIKYTPDGETVTLRASRKGNAVQIDIHNSGSYVPKEILPHLFQSFYRGEHSRATDDDGTRGTGLGLAIARGFVEAHGGKIWAESDPHHGTTFHFTLPLTH